MTSNELPYAFGGAVLKARIRSSPEDFVVDEQLGFTASGNGEHWLLHVEKRGANTNWAARQLAEFAGVDVNEIGFAGMKDRHAVTRQYFSLPARKTAALAWEQFDNAEVRVLEAQRHSRKLQRGALRGNSFNIILREVEGAQELAEQVRVLIRNHGVPNYFGEQRFGRDSGNLDKARAMFGGKRFERNERSLLLSAARAEIFNAALASRVRDRSWNQGRSGDVFQLDGKNAIFGPEPVTALLKERVRTGDIHPTGPLWGRGDLRTKEAIAELEIKAASDLAELRDGVIAAGMQQERRALRVLPRSLNFEWLDAHILQIQFMLPAGAYATTVLRELVQTSATDV